MRLDIGCGDHPRPGFDSVDIARGRPAYPLDVPAGSVEEIRASHVLEHFGHGLVPHVLADWFRALQPGGLIRIAVPDFEWVARAYLSGHNIPVQGYVMGGQVDPHDHHGTIFDRETLSDALRAAGFVGISDWTSEGDDCSALPVSLNLQAWKPPEKLPRIRAVISVPRLGWNDMWGCTFEVLGGLGIRMTKVTGAFWEQCLTRGLTEALADDPDYVLTLDYDSVFERNDLLALISAAERHPEAAAIAALQVHRSRATPLMTVRGENGFNRAEMTFDELQQELTQARTAHFGLTLIRADRLRELPRPWLHGQPDESGEWGEERTDPDIAFWRNWEKAGNTLYVTNRVPVGHLEVMIRWPGRQMSAVHQHPDDYRATGRPEDVWR